MENSTDRAIITKNYNVLLGFDGDDLLFYGSNKNGENVIGSISEEHDDIKIINYIHSVVDESILNAFKSREITYLTVLKKANKIYLIEKKYSGEQHIMEINYFNIPKDCLPLEDSFLPV